MSYASITMKPCASGFNYLRIAGLIATLTLPAAAWALTAIEIMDKNFVVGKYADSTSDTTMTLTNKSEIGRAHV